MINPGNESAKRSQDYVNRIAQLTFEYYQLNEQSIEIHQRMREIDLQITNLRGAQVNNDIAARQFDSYLAVKENAITLQDIKNGVKEAAAQEKTAGKKPGEIKE